MAGDFDDAAEWEEEQVFRDNEGQDEDLGFLDGDVDEPDEDEVEELRGDSLLEPEDPFYDDDLELDEFPRNPDSGLPSDKP